MSFSLAWTILEVADAEDRRARRLQARRNNKYLKLDPFKMSNKNFVKNYRLDKESVQMLINLMQADEEVRRRRRRDGIPLQLKVFLALAFYAVGSYQTLVGGRHNVSQVSTSRAVHLVTHFLNKPNIFGKFVKFPMTRPERDLVKQRFFQKFKLPGVVGCIDGTHIAIIRPQQHEERFYNRKGYHSLNVMIICDADLKILCIDPSKPGSMHDSTVWRDHPLSGYLNTIFDEGEQVYLLGDSGYPLRKTVMTPYLDADPGTPEAFYYNTHVSARNTVERCIGVLKARFRCCLFARQLHYNPVFAAKIVNACAVLHNIALRKTPARTLDPQWNIMENSTPHAETVQTRNNDLMQGRAVQRSLINSLWANRRL